MRKTTVYSSVLSMIILMACWLIQPAHAQMVSQIQSFPTLTNPQDAYVADEVVVKFKSQPTVTKLDEIRSRIQGVFKKINTKLNFGLLQVPAGQTVEEMIAACLADPEIEYAEPNYKIYAHFTPNDPYYMYQWNLNSWGTGGIHMEEAWDIATGDFQTIIAIVDTGIAYQNYTAFENGVFVEYDRAPDLAQTSFTTGYDFVNDDTHPNDDQGHGTHVAGTLAQSTHNSIGVAGIAFDARLMPVKVLNNEGEGTYADVAEGIIWATDNGANVINLSLGSPSPGTIVRDALAYAYNYGVTSVCSSGNNGNGIVNYPAAYNDYCIAVGATRYDETLAWYSNYGSALDLVAPGGDNNVDQNNDGLPDGILQQTFVEDQTEFGYYLGQGTSMAAPHVAGLAALLISTGKATTPDEVRHVLETTAKDLGVAGRDNTFGWGLIDAYAALTYQNESANTPPLADPGGPYAADVNQTVNFNGSGSSDFDGDDLTFAWDFGDGSSGTGENPSHAYGTGGTYTVTLIVNDGQVDSVPVSTQVSVSSPNTPPSADPGGPYAANVNEAVNFNGSGSSDPDGDGLTFDWNFGDGSTGTGENPSHAYGAGGIYTVTLIVNDGQADSAPVTTQVEVTSTNQPPVANPNGPYEQKLNYSVFFSSNGSYDPEGEVFLDYFWDFGDGDTSTSRNPAHRYDNPGVYTVTLVVNDGEVNSAPAQTTATILGDNTPPTADTDGPYAGEVGESIRFDGSFSSDAEGSISSYQWDFGDGASSSGVIVNHAYASEGVYTVRLTVTDSQGATGTATTTATITDTATPPPSGDLFFDSFEDGEWNGLWTEDAQNDWAPKTFRRFEGRYAAEVDGSTTDAALTSIPINLQGATSVTVSFAWYMDQWLDAGEYIAFDVSTDGGNSWVEYKRLRADVDGEEVWHQESFIINGISQLQLRFRGSMSSGGEDAYVDVVRVVEN